MGNEPPAASLANLQYQSSFAVSSTRLVRLVGKWCLITGGLDAWRMGFVIASLFRNGSLLLRDAIDFPPIFIVMISLIASILLVICALFVLLGQQRYARWFWILLLVLLAMNLSSEATWYVRLWQRSPGQLTIPISQLLYSLALACLPEAILLSISRLPDVADAISGAH